MGVAGPTFIATSWPAVFRAARLLLRWPAQMQRPLVGVVLALVGGMAAAHVAGLPAWMHGVLAAVGLASVPIPGGSRVDRLFMASALVGAWMLASSMDRTGPLDAATVIPAAPHLGRVRGTVLDPGEARAWTNAAGTGWSRSMEVELEGWATRGGAWRPVRGLARVRIRDAKGVAPMAGQRFEATGVVREPPGPLLPGGFDLRQQLRARGIDRSCDGDDASDWVALDAPARAWGPRFQAWAHGALSRGVPDDEATRLIRAMVLGWRGGLDESWREAFLRSGTLHVFAISGLHIALVAGLVGTLMRLARVGRGWCAAGILPVTWAYVAATGWQASAIRSAAMASVVALGWSLRRPSDIVNSLAAAALLVLAWDPRQVLQPGFQLSFGVVAGMALWAGPLERVLRLEWTRPVLVPEEARPAWRRWLRTPLHGLRVNLATSASAWMTSMPFTVQWFGLVSFAALGANLVVVPLSGLCLVAGLGSLLAAPAWPGLSEWLNQSAWLWMKLMMGASAWASSCPGAFEWVEAPHWAWWLGPGWLLFVAGPRWAEAGRLDWRLGGPVAGWVVAAGIALALELRTARMVCFPWGAGALVEAGWGRRVLMDVGPAGATRRVLVDWLHARGVDRLDAGVAGSGEARFASGWPEVLADVGSRDWWMGPGTTPSMERARQAALDERIPVHRLKAGREAEGWRVTWPPEDGGRERSDAKSLVMDRMLGGVGCLWMPSLNPEAQRRWMATRPTNLSARVCLAGLPSQGEPLVDEMLDALKPELVVLMAGERPATHRLGAGTRLRLRRWALRNHARLWVTDEQGAVELRCRDGRWWVATRDADEAR